MDRARGHGLFVSNLSYFMGLFSKLTERFDQTKNSRVACDLTSNVKAYPPHNNTYVVHALDMLR
jgi:hypothetical protein